MAQMVEAELLIPYARQGRIGEVRHLSWTLTKAPSPKDLDGSANWRTDPAAELRGLA